MLALEFKVIGSAKRQKYLAALRASRHLRDESGHSETWVCSQSPKGLRYCYGGYVLK